MPLFLMRNNRATEALQDGFARLDTSPGSIGSEALGRTALGNLQWKILSGSWQILAGQAATGSSGFTNPIAVVESGVTNAEVSASVGAGGDAVYGRVIDINNWVRVRSRRYTVEVSNPIYYPPTYTTYYVWHSQYSSENPYNTGYHSHLNRLDSPDGLNCPHPDRIDHVHDGIPTHGHFRQGCGVSSTYEKQTGGGYTDPNVTTETRNDAVLEKNVGGTISTMAVVAMGATAIAGLALRMSGTSVWVGVNGGAFFGPTTITDHANGVQHGIGRATSEIYAHGIDNFTLTPLA